MQIPIVESLWRYPITGGPGISVDQIDVIAGGFVDDRTLILATETDQGLKRIGTKQAPKLLQMRYQNDGATVQLGDVEIDVPLWSLRPDEEPDAYCDEFGDQTPVLFVGEDYDEAFSTYLDQPVRMVRKSSAWQLGDVISPRERANAALHVIGLESVTDLAGHNDIVPDSRRFKPNIVWEGMDPHAELAMIGECLRLGSLATSSKIQIDRGTARCPVPSFDPETGENLHDMSLTTMPKSQNPKGKEAASAGAYAHLVDAHGTIAVGDTVARVDL